MMNPNDPASPQIHNPKATPPKRTANPTTSQAPSVNMAEMPTVSQLQKRQPDHAPQKKPFQWQFLLPRYWGIWLGVAILLPLIYLPLRLQFKIGSWLGRVLYHLIKSRRQDTLTNLALAFPELEDEARAAMAKQVFVNAGIVLMFLLGA